MKLVCLTGGGFRGVYSASVIANLEKHFNTSVLSRANCFAGTSIGGILALGLAAGKTGEQLVDAFKTYGPIIFQPKPKYHTHYYSTRYCKDALEKAIRGILGEVADKTLEELANIHDTHIMLTAVELDTGRTVSIDSISKTKKWKVIDAALATSSAPTYFPCKTYKSIRYIDGGVSCNMPDIYAALKYSRHKDIPINTLSVLSIGTGQVNLSNHRKIDDDAGSLTWAKNLPFFLDVQIPQVEEQCEALFDKNHYARIDTVFDNEIKLDDIRHETMLELTRLADISTQPRSIIEDNALLQFMNTPRKKIKVGKLTFLC